MNIAPIFVTKPYLPPIEEVMPYLQRIWLSRVLTNGGELHAELETKLCQYLGVKHISLFSNATIALLAAFKALDLQGEVITTPFTFVATAHSLLWNNLKPIFIDIDPNTLNLDPSKIEEAITANTSAILPVHVYGRPCDVDAIDLIAKKHSLKVVYDAAHAFGVHCHCGSVLNHGDLSVLSFHATKVFNTFEGGAIISQTPEMKRKIDQLKNFGFVNETTVDEVGINGKMAEFNAAIGLTQLPHLKVAIHQRAAIAKRYHDGLSGVMGIECLDFSSVSEYNYSYFPIVVNTNSRIDREQLYSSLKTQGIHVRRYFYPLLTELPMYKMVNSAQLLPNATKISNQILCLPIYPDLSADDVDRVVACIKECM
jgi:dTDP-4-amino-4,6-dideoxygalactose transaminase